jgi:hypothetical protein
LALILALILFSSSVAELLKSFGRREPFRRSDTAEVAKFSELDNILVPFL